MGRRSIDITGQKFGRLTAIFMTAVGSRGRSSMWLFKCDCGNENEINKGSVVGGQTQSCGCRKGCHPVVLTAEQRRERDRDRGRKRYRNRTPEQIECDRKRGRKRTQRYKVDVVLHERHLEQKRQSYYRNATPEWRKLKNEKNRQRYRCRTLEEILHDRQCAHERYIFQTPEQRMLNRENDRIVKRRIYDNMTIEQRRQYHENGKKRRRNWTPDQIIADLEYHREYSREHMRKVRENRTPEQIERVRKHARERSLEATIARTLLLGVWDMETFDRKQYDLQRSMALKILREADLID
jgi:hypothetical protein